MGLGDKDGGNQQHFCSNFFLLFAILCTASVTIWGRMIKKLTMANLFGLSFLFLLASLLPFTSTSFNIKRLFHSFTQQQREREGWFPERPYLALPSLPSLFFIDRQSPPGEKSSAGACPHPLFPGLFLLPHINMHLTLCWGKNVDEWNEDKGVSGGDGHRANRQAKLYKLGE
jgi:hypothetical protein